MAGLDPAIPFSKSKEIEFVIWMAASEGGHDNKGIPNDFDTL